MASDSAIQKEDSVSSPISSDLELEGGVLQSVETQTFETRPSTYRYGEDDIERSGEYDEECDEDDLLQRHYETIGYLPPFDGATLDNLKSLDFQADRISPQNISKFRQGLK
jgi:hypothetical protein